MTAEDHIKSLPRIRRSGENTKRRGLSPLLILCVIECIVLVLVTAIGVWHRRAVSDISLAPIEEWETPLSGLSISDGELLTTYEQSSHSDRSDIDDIIEVTGSAVIGDTDSEIGEVAYEYAFSGNGDSRGEGIASVPAVTVETPDMMLEAPILALSPDMPLKAGDYTLTLNYTASVDQYAVLIVNGYDEPGAIKLSKNLSTVNYHFTIPKDADDVRFAVSYGFYGDITLISAALNPNMNGLKRVLVALIVLFLALDAAYIFRERLWQERVSVLGVAIIFVLSILPLFAEGIPLGQDLKFHLMRIDGLAQELKYGQIPVRMQSLWMDGFSYPVSVLYGDIFLYIPAILRLCGYTVTEAYQIYIAIMDLLITVTTYICMKRIFDDRIITLITTAGYVLSAYRVVDIYARAAVGEAASYLALPIVAAAICVMYADKSSNHRTSNIRGRDDAGMRIRTMEWGDGGGMMIPVKNGLILAVGMTVLFFTHNLSVIMTSVFLLIVAVVLIKRTLRRDTIISWIVAVVGTILLSAVYLIPLVDYTINADLNSAVNADETMIQWGGAYIYQYFMVFKNYFGFNSVNLSERFNLSPGLILMIGFVAAAVHIVLGHASKRTKYLFAFSVIALWLSSNLFPWDFLSEHISTQFAMIQFPWRFLPIASACMTLLLGSVMETVFSHAIKRKIEEKAKRGMVLVFVAAAVISAGVYAFDTFAHDYIASYRDIDEVDHYCVTSFFLRDGIMDDEPLSLSMTEFSGVDRAELIARAGTTAIYEVETDKTDSDEKAYFEAPIFNYPYYEATTEVGDRLAIEDGTKKLIRVYVPSGYSGQVTIEFVPPILWHIAEIISLISWVAVGVVFAGWHSRSAFAEM